MNLIGLVLTIVLMALISTVGYFYGGPAYTNSRTSAEVAKLQDDFGQLSSALRLAFVMGVPLKPSNPQEGLVSSGILVDVPKFNGVSYSFWSAGDESPVLKPDGSINYAFIVMSDVSESLCSEVNYRTFGRRSIQTIRGSMPPVGYYLMTNNVEVSEDMRFADLGSMVCFEDAYSEPDAIDDAVSVRYVMFALDKKVIREGVKELVENMGGQHTVTPPQ